MTRATSFLLCLGLLVLFCAPQRALSQSAVCRPTTRGTIGRIIYLPATAIQNSALNPAAKSAVLQQPICALRGDQIFLRPTITVHYFRLTRSGAVRSETRSYNSYLSVERRPAGTVLHFANGVQKHFGPTALVVSTSPENYQLFIVAPNGVRPAALASASAPDYIAP